MSIAINRDMRPPGRFNTGNPSTHSLLAPGDRLLFETAGDGILILDAVSGRILDVNPFLQRLLGRSRADFLGKELWQLGSRADIEASRAAFRALQEHGHVRYEHLPLETGAGRPIDVEFVSDTYARAGVGLAQCRVRDITERRRLERQMRAEMEAAADLNRRKDEFLAVVCHELRGPLPAIVNAVHLLRHEQCDESVRHKAAAMIDRQVKQLARLVDDLLDNVRSAAGRLQLRRERVDLRSVVDKAVETVQPLVERRNHDLSVSMPSAPVWLYIDASRIEQVVVNLLTNAAKYTLTAGRIWIAVEVQGGAVEIRVRDNGIGIAPELMPNVFALFSQADTSSKQSNGGLGIGLSVVERLVEMHGGTVVASSPGLGLGSQFVVRLPAVPSAQQAAKPHAPVTETPAKIRHLSGVVNHLAADDVVATVMQSVRRAV